MSHRGTPQSISRPIKQTDLKLGYKESLQHFSGGFVFCPLVPCQTWGQCYKLEMRLLDTWPVIQWELARNEA